MLCFFDDVNSNIFNILFSDLHLMENILYMLTVIVELSIWGTLYFKTEEPLLESRTCHPHVICCYAAYTMCFTFNIDKSKSKFRAALSNGGGDNICIKIFVISDWIGLIWWTTQMMKKKTKINPQHNIHLLHQN